MISKSTSALLEINEGKKPDEIQLIPKQEMLHLDSGSKELKDESLWSTAENMASTF